MRETNRGGDDETEHEATSKERDRYHTRHDDTHDSLSVTVIEALAEAKGVSPVEMEEPLYQVIDPDALDSLFTADEEDDPTGRLVFTTDGYEVSVHSDGHVYVRQVE